MYKRILLTYDGSDPGRKALLDSLDIAQWSHAELFLVAVMPNSSSLVMGSVEGGIYVGPNDGSEKQKYQAVLDSGFRQLTESGLSAKGELLVGDSVEEITRYAEKIEADLIVVGHKHLDGGAVVAWVQFAGADRVRSLQRTGRDHQISCERACTKRRDLNFALRMRDEI